MIRLDRISLRRGPFEIRSLDLAILPKEYFVLLGPTGSGKTSVLELIAGVQTPDGGKVWWNGREITPVPPERRNVGMVYQGYHLFPHLTVDENIRYGLRIRKIPSAEQERRVRFLSELLGIELLLGEPTQGLSGGEQQRVALARSLAIEPELLLLDEPLSALDPQTRRQLQQDLKRLHEKLQTTTIHVTHSFEEALNLADRVGILYEGRLLQLGEPMEVFRRPQSRPVAEFIGMENIYRGTVKRVAGEDSNGDANAVFSTEGLDLAVLSESEGPAYACIRPEEILLSVEPVHSSAMNNYKGVVRDISDHRIISRVTVEAPIPFVAFITKTSQHRMELKTGSEVYVTFKASAVHLF